jgi:hypothetical protein
MSERPQFVLGVDPGLQGALCLYEIFTRRIEVFDMPVTDGRVDPAKLAAIVEMCKVRGTIHAAVENVNARPGQAHTWAFALSVGIVHGCLGALSVPLNLIQPAQWKSAYGLRRAPNETQADTKARARLLATELWPKYAENFKRVKDADRAESSLIARFCAAKMGWLC